MNTRGDECIESLLMGGRMMIYDRMSEWNIHQSEQAKTGKIEWNLRTAEISKTSQ